MAVGVESLNVWLVTASNWRSILCLSLEIEIDNWVGLSEPKRCITSVETDGFNEL
jgi:hypothetical protein